MKRTLLASAAIAAALLTPVQGRSSNPVLVEANLAWERGDYVAALTGYLKLLDSDAESLEPIALQTGELYHSTELTTDGAAPRFSPDGRFIVYETGAGPRRHTRLVPAGTPAGEATDLPGFGVVFSPDGSKLAYLAVTPTPEIEDAQAAVDRAPAGIERVQRLAQLNALLSDAAVLTLRDAVSGQEATIDTGALQPGALLIAIGDLVLFEASTAAGPTDVYAVARGSAPKALTSGDTDKSLAAVNSTGTAVLIAHRPQGPGGRGGRAGGPGGALANRQYSILLLPDEKSVAFEGLAAAFSADGRTIAYTAREGNEYRLMAGPVTDPANAAVVRKGPERLEAPALSPDGSRIAFQMMPHQDWEIYVVNVDGSAETRVTREIQHDLLPQFLTSDRILAVVGEPRHRRSYLYELATMRRTRLFHNNTVRTIAPEYIWSPNREGNRVLISAERDGDTVSTQRGVYLMDLSRRITRDELRSRVTANLEAEEALRARGKRLYAKIAGVVRTVVGEASVARVYGYEKSLFDFDSKHITRPGNKRAAGYLFETYKSFGYQPEYQWFEARNALDGQTANVLATLQGTVNPELVYVVSSHYDSVAVGPGADDDSSGTAALLETARILARHPQPATIVFASFTGEEAGLLGSREFVRRAVENKVQVVGALNNDMIGWANDFRLDNTIRYSNPGIRDIQHAAAMQFTNLITYDALYYKGTDAAAYYEAYGDIVGGIGSYPVLGNPHYHQPHDLLETIDHQLVTEVAKTTAATLMLLASSPSRLTGLKVDSFAQGRATISWKPSPERGVTGYNVAYGAPSKPEVQLTVGKPSVTLTGVAAGTVVSVKAVNENGLEGWDWARVTIK